MVEPKFRISTPPHIIEFRKLEKLLNLIYGYEKIRGVGGNENVDLLREKTLKIIEDMYEKTFDD